MRLLRIVFSRLRGTVSRRRLDEELNRELKFHIEMLTEENQRNGMDRREARHAALRSFGGVEQVKANYRDRRGLPMIETTFQDILYGIRMFLKKPGFTAATSAS